MKQIRKILTAILILISNLTFAQYNEISDQDLVLRSWKTYGLSDGASDNNVLKMWLSIFDKKNYATYAKNEFTLKDKLDQTKQSLLSRLNNMENIAIYYHTESRSFGEYDFAKEQYNFKPFNNFSTEKRLSYTWSDYEKYFRTNLKFFGLDFVDGIPMEKIQAEQFLNRKQQNNIWGQSYNNRTVYLKIYYYTSIEDKVEKSYEFKAYDENKLKCTPLLVQAFGDKNYTEFVCEWWDPGISSYYKQQLINNNVPRGFYESLNQPAQQTNSTSINLPFIGKKEFDFYHPASGLAPTYYVIIKPNGDVTLGFAGGDYSGSKEVNIGKYTKVMNIASFENIKDEKYCVITKDNMYLSDQFGNKISKDDCCKFNYEYNCPCESKLYSYDNDIKYNGPVTISFKKNISTIPNDKIDELNNLIDFLKQNPNYKYKVINFLYAENNENETQQMMERIQNIYEYFNTNGIGNTRRIKIQSNEAYDQFTSNERKMIVKLIQE